ncbi:hypothetical protein MKK65_00905 [Methylobacterium sp. J-001]|uniref:hypothetical protein n=1 Tax=Methylobacterium sp. J-001 TaxID=2836609 RepID=UPI001FB9B061|nr:hypothetical protein [Methylobacterium sp. J-001]MCJ2115170.1 hypothetical protein [Methylobacterium sp. J-001]
MAGEIEAYLNARLAFEECRTEIETIADEIVRVGALIKKDPARICFSDTENDLPPGSFSGQKYPASDWKSASELQNLLVRFHAARANLRAAWTVVPPALRSGLQPPPTGVLPPQQFGRKEHD